MADANFDNVVLLLNFDGADAATATTDASKYNCSVRFAGDAQLDTANFKYGTASLLTDGTGDAIGVGWHDGFELGTSDFTIEFDAILGSSEPGNVNLCGIWNQGNNDRVWQIIWDASNNQIEFQYSTTGSNTIAVL